MTRERALVERPEDDVGLRDVRRVSASDAPTRERWAETIAARLDTPMSVLGVVFLLVVLGQTLASGDAVQTGLAVAGWLLWVVFVAELALRWYVSPDRRAFLRRSWWQVVFLAVPFLRFVRLVAVLRVARVGRVVSSAVRSSRSARRLVADRIGWLAAVSAIVVLASSQLLFAAGLFDEYGDALHAAAVTTVTGQPLGVDAGLAQLLDVVLGVYSVVVFATLAGTLGAYFLEGRDRRLAGAPDRR